MQQCYFWRFIIKLDLSNRWVLVGGASQGIGRATALALAECGAKVILMSRRAAVLESVKASLPNSSAHKVFAVDLENTAELITAIEKLVQETGPISVWVNNTGGPKAGPLVEADSRELERAFRGHVIAAQVILQALTPGMKEQKYGRIINVLSTSVKIPIVNLGVSNTIRSAMANWAKTLANEVGPFGITVNNILPGFTETPRLEALAGGTAQNTGKSEVEVRRDWAQMIPLKRLADPRETASAIAFLASPLASYITGVNLPVDGGRTGAL